MLKWRKNLTAKLKSTLLFRPFPKNTKNLPQAKVTTILSIIISSRGLCFDGDKDVRTASTLRPVADIAIHPSSSL